MHHHGLVLPRPFGPNQSHKIQEISGVIRNAVIRPSQVLDLSELSLLLSLQTHTQVSFLKFVRVFFDPCALTVVELLPETC